MALGSKRLCGLIAAISLAVVALASTIHAGGLIGRNRSVGGVSVDASGMIRDATVDETAELANLIRVSLDTPRGELADRAELRMVSLRGLQEAIANHNHGGALPEEITLLAGLQRIEYVFVDEENNDIVIAGPAEPWKLGPDGAVVGAESGQSVLYLDDLVVALRSVDVARREGISCSIEPTAEGRQRLKRFLSRVRLGPGQNPAMLEMGMKQAYGPQQVLLTGVPSDSRYALTMVAADYQMKRIAMALNDSPVAGLPSYLEMARNDRHVAGQNPRWWMACDYEALTRSADGLAWKVSGQGVKTLTEQDIAQADGTVSGSGKQDKTAAKWAELMTEHYGELSREMPVFRDLRNLMDMTVVATLIRQERLAERAGLDLSILIGDDSAVELATYPSPRSVAPQCSFVRTRGGVIATASGGVDVNAFEVVQRQREDRSLTADRTQALASNSEQRWWWDR